MPDDYYVSQYSGEEIDALLASAGVPIGITKEYQSVTEMNQDFTGTDVQRGQFVLILTTDTSSEDYGKVYLKGTANWVYVFTLTSLTAIKGPQGPAGKQGPAGSNFTILGYFDTLAALQAAVPNPKAGDAYGVGTAAPYNIYIWDSVHSKWVNNGNLQGNADVVITEIPKGRMRGDIKGIGKVGTETDLQNSGFMNKAVDPTNPDSWACDTDANGMVNPSDKDVLHNYNDGRASVLTQTPTFADFYNNWTYHKMDDKSGYWTTDLVIPDVTAEMDVSVSVQGLVLENTFIKAEPVAGGVRIHANYPPIRTLPCSVTYGKGTGRGSICAAEGVSDAQLETTFSSVGTKAIRVKLLAANWSSSDQTQVVAAPGVIYSQRAQLIIPMPAYSKSVEYHDAGILCIGQNDDELTFKCKTIPTVDIIVYVNIVPVNFVQ